MRIRMVAAAGVAAVVMGAAACSSSSSSTGAGSGTPSSASASGAAGSGAPLKTATIGGVTVVTNGRGFTLYSFAPDTATTSKCSGACAQIWPPLLVTSGPPAAPSGLAGKIGAVTWSDGTVQVTLDGQPLYLYAADFKAGDTNGDGVDGVWAAAKN